MIRLRLGLLAFVALGSLALSSTAEAAYPGTNGKIAYVRDDTEIWTIGSTGTGAEQLGEFSTYGNIRPEGPSWAPDQERVAFYAFCCYNVGKINVWSVGADGEGTTQHTFNVTDQNPEYDPLANNIVFSSDQGDDPTDPTNDFDIYRFNVGSGLELVLHDSPYYDIDPTYSPDGGTVAFTRYAPGGLGGLWTTPADGSGEEQITDGDDSDPDYSPDGTSIAFTRDDRIYLADADGNGAHQLSSDPDSGDWDDASPSFSPDGKKIVFERTFDPIGSPTTDLVVYDIASGNETQITSSGISGDPDWGAGAATPPPSNPACSDGIDNDGDGKIDYPADPGCESSTDTSEVDTAPPPTTTSPATPPTSPPSTTPDEPDTTVDAGSDVKNKQSGTTVKLRVTCEETCTTVANGLIKANLPSGKNKHRLAARPHKGGHKGRRLKVKLKRVHKQLNGGGETTLKLRPKGKKANRKLKHALKHRAKAKAKIKLKITDAAGNSSTDRLKVTLKK